MTIFQNKPKTVAFLFVLIATHFLSACAHQKPTGASFSGEARWNIPTQEGDSLHIHVFDGEEQRGTDHFSPLGQGQEMLLEPGSTSQVFEVTLDNDFLATCKQSNRCIIHARIAQISAQINLLSQSPLILELKASTEEKLIEN